MLLIVVTYDGISIVPSGRPPETLPKCVTCRVGPAIGFPRSKNRNPAGVFFVRRFSIPSVVFDVSGIPLRRRRLRTGAPGSPLIAIMISSRVLKSRMFAIGSGILEQSVPRKTPNPAVSSSITPDSASIDERLNRRYGATLISKITVRGDPAATRHSKKNVCVVPIKGVRSIGDD